MSIDEVRLFARLHEQLGLDRDAALRVLAATLEPVGLALAARDAARLAGELPEALRPALARRRRRRRTLEAAQLYGLVDEATGLGRAHAREAVQVACAALGEQLDPEMRAHLGAHLSGSAAALFEPPAPLPEPEPTLHPAERRTRTLSEGRPGSPRPMSEAGFAHTESIAASPAPHAEQKLSTSHGISTEREHTTLAEGRAGSTHPVSESKT
jgi:uncharacterized protein (DUF2267 family)